MMRSFQRWLIILVITVACFVLLSDSQSFRQCIAETDQGGAPQTPEEYVTRLPIMLDTTRVCAGAVLDQHGEAVTALFTVVLAISTILLWSATRNLARAAQQAATISERALTHLERPFVYAEVTKPGLKVSQYTPLGRTDRLARTTLELSMFNVGRTPAILTRVEYVIVPARTGSIADPINPTKTGGRELPVGTISISGRPFVETTNLALHFMEEATAISDGDKSVWLVGFVRYRDIFGQHQITGFTQVFDPIGERFLARGDDKYNYAHSEKASDIPEPSSRG
jgi:hypothetical protein